MNAIEAQGTGRTIATSPPSMRANRRRAASTSFSYVLLRDRARRSDRCRGLRGRSPGGPRSPCSPTVAGTSRSPIPRSRRSAGTGCGCVPTAPG